MKSVERKSKVLPQFFPALWVEDLGEIVSSPFPSRIRIGYVLRDEGSYSYLLHEQFESMGMTLEELYVVALQNLAQLPGARMTFADVAGGPEGYITADDNFAAVRILLPEVRAAFISKLGQQFFATIPHRDDCFCWSRTQPDDRQARHAAQALEDFTQDDYGLTPDVFLVNSSGFRLFREQRDV